METAMDEEDRALEQLKAQMTGKQRQEMADLLKSELKRRMKAKTEASMAKPKEKSKVTSSGIGGGLDRQSAGEMYQEMDKTVQELRVRKLEAQLNEAKRNAQRYGKFLKPQKGLKERFLSPEMISMPRVSGSAAPLKSLLLMSAIVLLAVLKVIFSSGVVNASPSPAKNQIKPAPIDGNIQAEAAPAEQQQAQAAGEEKRAEQPAPVAQTPGNWSSAEKQVLTALDARRVDLEKRKAALDKKETEIKNQAQALADRVAELRTLTEKLAKIREEKDQRFEARMGQLADVYGSMAPTEASPLIAKLDTQIALGLLERMPGKRMGQILSAMEPQRAIELTKSLTDRKKI